MPFERRTPFGTSRGNMTDEERAGMQMNMWNTDRSDRRQMADRSSEIALRQLQEMSRQFDAGRQDRGLDRQSQADLAKMGYDFQSSMFDKQGAREDTRFGKQFDYMAGRDSREDAFRNKQFDFMNRNAGTQDEMLKSQLALQKLLMQGEESKLKRQQAAAGADLSPLLKGGALSAEEQAIQNALVAGGQDPVQANLAIAEERKGKAEGSANVLADKLNTDFRRFAGKDSAWFQSDPTEQEAQNIVLQFQALVKAYEDAGMAPNIAKQRAAQVLEQAGLSSAQGDDFDTDAFSDQTTNVLRQVGLR